jgi:retron-type reverse transcriptase
LTKWYLAGCLPYGDIADCFGSLDHNLIISALAEHIQDGRFLNLVKKLLDAGYMDNWTFNKTLSGVPQGSIRALRSTQQ